MNPPLGPARTGAGGRPCWLPTPLLVPLTGTGYSPEARPAPRRRLPQASEGQGRRALACAGGGVGYGIGSVAPSGAPRGRGGDSTSTSTSKREQPRAVKSSRRRLKPGPGRLPPKHTSHAAARRAPQTRRSALAWMPGARVLWDVGGTAPPGRGESVMSARAHASAASGHLLLGRPPARLMLVPSPPGTRARKKMPPRPRRSTPHPTSGQPPKAPPAPGESGRGHARSRAGLTDNNEQHLLHLEQPPLSAAALSLPNEKEGACPIREPVQSASTPNPQRWPAAGPVKTKKNAARPSQMDERPPPRDNNKQAPAATSHDSRQMKRRRDGGYFSRSASTPLLLASGLGTRRAGRGASASLPGPVQGWPTPKATNWPRRTAGDPHAPRGPSRGNPTPKNTRTHERRCCGRSSGKAAEPAIAVSPIVERDCGLGDSLL